MIRNAIKAAILTIIFATSIQVANARFVIAHASMNRGAAHNTQRAPIRSCGCVVCFGLCDVIVLGIEIGPQTSIVAPSNPSFIMDDPQIGNTATIYFLSTPDIDVQDDPHFYVDENVAVTASTVSTNITPAAYNYDATEGNLALNGTTYHYYGSAIVNVTR